jgi:GNAT superfamily N-acetyltransferase
VSDLRLGYLADHPDAVDPLARWHHAAWGHLIPDWTVAEAAAELAGHTGRRTAPTTVVAFADADLAGSASLLLEDMPGTPPYAPWLASVYVVPAFRRRGIGARMVTRVVEDARALGFSSLHLFTTEAEGWYASRGWRPRERFPYAGEAAVIMALDLGGRSTTL